MSTVPQWLHCRWCEWKTSRYTKRGRLHDRAAHLRLIEHISDEHPRVLPGRLVSLMHTAEAWDGKLA